MPTAGLSRCLSTGPALPQGIDPRLSRGAIAVLAAALAVLAVWPRTDIAVSALFFDPVKGFALNGHPVAEAVRRTIWNLSIVLLAAALVGLVAALLRRRPVAGLPARVWGFIVGLYAIGPGLLVETLFKGHWGRARPSELVEFGGTAGFTPFWQPADQCSRNCSFVAGEAAGAMALAIALAVVLAWAAARLPRPARIAARAVIVALPLLAAVQRLGAGRHFLSDILAAWLVIGLVAVVLAGFLRPLPGPVDKATDSP